MLDEMQSRILAAAIQGYASNAKYVPDPKKTAKFAIDTLKEVQLPTEEEPKLVTNSTSTSTTASKFLKNKASDEILKGMQFMNLNVLDMNREELLGLVAYMAKEEGKG